MSFCDGNIPSGGTNYPPIGVESGIYTRLHDDYDTLFEARHGRGAWTLHLSQVMR